MEAKWCGQSGTVESLHCCPKETRGSCGILNYCTSMESSMTADDVHPFPTALVLMRVSLRCHNRCERYMENCDDWSLCIKLGFLWLTSSCSVGCLQILQGLFFIIMISMFMPCNSFDSSVYQALPEVFYIIFVALYRHIFSTEASQEASRVQLIHHFALCALDFFNNAMTPDQRQLISRAAV